MLSGPRYRELLTLARHEARGRIEADDLLHEALAAALRAGRGFEPGDRPWLRGTMRNIARMNARSAFRRSRREVQYAGHCSDGTRMPATVDDVAVDGLSPAARIVALLALSGHNRAEIRYLLGVSDEVLRQRIATVRRVLGRQGTAPSDFSGLRGALRFGAIRRGLLPLVTRQGAGIGTHDPDGHPIAFGFFRGAAHRTATGGNRVSEAS